jgi:hypothetical protein
MNTSIRNQDLRTLVLNINDQIKSISVGLIQKDTRTFDIVVKPKNKMTQIYLIISVVEIFSPIRKDHYIVNRFTREALCNQ